MMPFGQDYYCGSYLVSKFYSSRYMLAGSGPCTIQYATLTATNQIQKEDAAITITALSHRSDPVEPVKIHSRIPGRALLVIIFPKFNQALDDVVIWFSAFDMDVVQRLSCFPFDPYLNPVFRHGAIIYILCSLWYWLHVHTLSSNVYQLYRWIHK